MAFEDQNLFGDPITEEYFRRKASSQIAPAQIKYAQALSQLDSSPMSSGNIIYGEEIAGRNRARQNIATGLASSIASAQSGAESANIAAAADQRTRARAEDIGFEDALERMRWGAGTKLLQMVPDIAVVMGSLDEKAREATGKGIDQLVDEEQKKLAELSIKRNQDPTRALVGGGGSTVYTDPTGARIGGFGPAIHQEMKERMARKEAGTPWYEGVPAAGGLVGGLANLSAEEARAMAANPELLQRWIDIKNDPARGIHYPWLAREELEGGLSREDLGRMRRLDPIFNPERALDRVPGREAEQPASPVETSLRQAKSPEEAQAALQGQGLGMKLNQDGTGSISPSQIPSDEQIIAEGRRQGLDDEQIKLALNDARRARGGGLSPLSGLSGAGVGGGLYRTGSR